MDGEGAGGIPLFRVQAGDERWEGVAAFPVWTTSHLHSHKQPVLIFRSVSLDDLLSLHGAQGKMTVFQYRPLPPF